MDPVDPFDTQSAHRIIESTGSFQKNGIQWPQNENSAPFPQTRDNKYVIEDYTSVSQCLQNSCM